MAIRPELSAARDRMTMGLHAAPDFTAACTIVVTTLHRCLPDYDWVGVYVVEGEALVLGAWAGAHHTDHGRIPIAHGICGAAVRLDETVIVDDVQSDPRYLACFTSTRAEIVVPIHDATGTIVGEIDVDGPRQSAFDADDREFLEELAARLGAKWSA